MQVLLDHIKSLMHCIYYSTFILQAEKRAHHNALERKRRDHIKDSFTSLREAVPALQNEKVVCSKIVSIHILHVVLIFYFFNIIVLSFFFFALTVVHKHWFWHPSAFLMILAVHNS